MAKRKSRRTYSRVARDANVYRYGRSTMRTLSSPSRLVLSPLRLLPLGDGRFFNPTPVISRPFVAAPRAAARLVVNGSGIQFKSPRGVLYCVRRKLRREVLFALGVGGQAGRKNKPRLNAGSEISC